MNVKGKNKEKSNSLDLLEKLIYVGRVSKTVKGGRTMSFSALAVVGDKSGRVGFGKGGASEVADAKMKAFEAAKSSMIKVSLKESRTIHHDITSTFCSARVKLRSAPPGTGIVAGGAMKAIFECVGIKDVVAKSLGTSNGYNVVRATFIALSRLISPKTVAEKRGIEISDVIKKRNINFKKIS